MSESTSLEIGLKALKELKIELPGIVDISTGLETKGLNFVVQAFPHAPRQPPLLPEFLSSTGRVTFDTARALELASNLDFDRSVPEQTRLCTTLARLQQYFSEDRVLELLHSDELDICIAYLRRVHFVVYYSGRKYRDEAHLLSQSPGVICRSAIRSSRRDSRGKIYS